MNNSNHNYPDLIAAKIRNLSVDRQQQVLDFVEFLAQKSILEQHQAKRVPDIHRDKIQMSEDFNEPLGDCFWLGKN